MQGAGFLGPFLCCGEVFGAAVGCQTLDGADIALCYGAVVKVLETAYAEDVGAAAELVA